MTAKMSIGKRIEDTMDFMMEISKYVAEKNYEVDQLNRTLNMYSTLFDVNKYMNKNLELPKLLPIVEDAMKATVGVNHAVVLISKHDTSCTINEVELTFEKVENMNIDDFVCYEDLSKDPHVDLNEGCLFIQKLDLVSEHKGYLLGYWQRADVVDDNKLDFLKILGVQTALSVKSSLMVEKLMEHND